jgi:hypothetical protein
VGQEELEIPFATLGDGYNSRGDQGFFLLIDGAKFSSRSSTIR